MKRVCVVANTLQTIKEQDSCSHNQTSLSCPLPTWACRQNTPQPTVSDPIHCTNRMGPAVRHSTSINRHVLD